VLPRLTESEWRWEGNLRPQEAVEVAFLRMYSFANGSSVGLKIHGLAGAQAAPLRDRMREYRFAQVFLDVSPTVILALGEAISHAQTLHSVDALPVRLFDDHQ
jgi:hypothetical protein